MAQARYFIGQIMQRAASNPNFLKVKIHKMQLDKNLLMYFPEETNKWAVDKRSIAKIGDIVLVKGIPKLTPEVDTEIESIVFKQGAIIDPVTGRPCRGTEYIDVEKREQEKLRHDTVPLTVTKTTVTDPVEET